MSKILKITQVVYPGYGGSGAVSFSISSGLKKIENIKIITSFIFIGNALLCKDYQTKCLKNNFSYLYIKNKFFKFISFYKIYYFLKKTKPDVIINHDNLILPFLLYCFFNNCKFIFVFHFPFFFNYKLIINFFYSLITADRVILVSKRKDFLNCLSKYIKKIQIIENGIDPNLFKKKCVKKNFFTIGMACRFVRQKKPDLLIDVVKKYKIFFLEKKIKISFVGVGPDLFKLKSTVKKNNLSEIINFKGYLNEIQMANWLNHLSIFVNLSDFETTPTTILQAFAIPIPVIASDIPGHQEISKRSYRNMPSLLLVENDIDKIFNKIFYLHQNQKQLDRYKVSAKFYSKKIYNDKFMAKKYLNMIKKIK